MGWINRILGTEEQAPTPQSTAPAAIRYHEQLIPEYLDTHKELYTQFDEALQAAQNTQFTKIPELLTKFKTTFESHLLTENVRFYVYLEQQFKGDLENTQIVKSFRTEMNGIARQVVQFTRKWKEDGVNIQNRTEFMAEHAHIKEVLQRRLNSEEKDLYPLYQPPL